MKSIMINDKGVSVLGSDGDKIYLELDCEIITVDLSRKPCQVKDCNWGHSYGYNFCSRHQWIMPISAENCPDGFQVAFIKYWKDQGKKLNQSHSYIESKYSKGRCVWLKVLNLLKEQKKRWVGGA